MSVVDEIFTKMSSHMIQGMMLHEQLMNCYEFLGLHGYSACHKYHYLSETIGYTHLCNYSINHFGKLIQNERITDPEIIPSSWLSSVRDDVDEATRKQAMIAGLDEWIEWESSTVELYSSCHNELWENKKIAAAEFVKSYILDAEEELTFAKNEKIKKSAMDFDIVSIIEEQDAWHKLYSKKAKKLNK